MIRIHATLCGWVLIMSHYKCLLFVCSAAAAAATAAMDADFTYSENPTGSISLPGETHAGFTAITNTLWREGIRAALWNHVVLGRITSVSVAGHSLGAGVATLVAYAAQVSEIFGCDIRPESGRGRSDCQSVRH